MKALALVIFTVVLTRSQCRVSNTYTLVLQDSGIQVAKLPDQSQVKLDCGPLAVAVFGDQANLTSMEWSKDSIQIADNYTVRSVLVINDNRELLINSLKAGGLYEDGTEGNYTCNVCLDQRCNESTIQVLTDPEGTLLNITRHVSIGAQAVVWVLVEVPVKLDCEEKAVAAFGAELNLSSIEWFYKDTRIDDNSTLRNIAISPNNLQLLVYILKIMTGAEDGTEGTFTCRACKNEPSPGFSKECQIFQTELIASSPPILGCDASPVPVPPSGFGALNLGCDMCVQHGQSVAFLTLDCTPDTSRLPTNCTIRNPDGITARDLDDGAAYISSYDQLTITSQVMNPEGPDPPTVLGNWTCTCVNENGMSTATSRIGECSCDPACVRGTCQGSFCACPEGWTGADCDTPVCDPACVRGTCTEDRVCVCPDGWTGEVCNTPVCVPACVRGTCTKDMVCVCPEGWIGEDCNTPIACVNATPSVTYNAGNQSLNITHYPPEGSVCKCVLKRKKKEPCLPRDTMSGVQLKNKKGQLVITCIADGITYKLWIKVKNE